MTSPDFPGILPEGPGFKGPRPTPNLHPHMKLEQTMTSIPKVNPGDMVFWHCVSIEISISGYLLMECVCVRILFIQSNLNTPGKATLRVRIGNVCHYGS